MNIEYNLATWKKFFDDLEADERLPEPFTELSPLGKLVLCKSIRPEQFSNYSKTFINAVCGDYFTQNLIIPLEKSFEDSET